MLHWFSETFLAMLNYVPALIVEEGSAHFELIRAMYGLIILVILPYLFVLAQPFIARALARVRSQFARKDER